MFNPNMVQVSFRSPKTFEDFKKKNNETEK